RKLSSDAHHHGAPGQAGEQHRASYAAGGARGESNARGGSSCTVVHLPAQSDYHGNAGAARIERGRWLPGILGNVANGDGGPVAEGERGGWQSDAAIAGQRR